MNQRKYQKYLSKYLKKSSSTQEQILDAFKKEYGHLKKEGLRIHSVGELIEGYMAISISIPKTFDQSKIPDNYRGLTIRISKYEE